MPTTDHHEICGQRFEPSSDRQRDGPLTQGPPIRDRRHPPESGSEHALPTHVALLNRARALEFAAILNDTDAVHLEFGRLRTELCEHLRGEHDVVAALPTLHRQVVISGQRDLLDHVDRLLDATEDGGGTCNCLRSAIEMVHRLVRQARLEGNIEAEAARRPLAGGPAR